LSNKEFITDARDANENSNAEDNFQMKFTSINLEREKATTAMEARFYEILELEYNRTKAGGTCMIKREEYDEFVSVAAAISNHYQEIAKDAKCSETLLPTFQY
jgi:hypothetical protein